MEVDMMTDPSTSELKADDDSQKGEKVTYKSFKKKFRKMKFKFEQKMNQSNIWYKQEQEAAEIARRLAVENDQLLDLLLDVNNSTQIPGHLRIDVSLDTPSISAVPSLMPDSLLTPGNTPESQLLHDQIRGMIDAKLQAKIANKPTKSLASLMSTVPHAPFEIPTVPYDLASAFPSLTEPELESVSFKPDHHQPLTYLSPDDIDEYLSIIDNSLSIPVAPRLSTTTNPHRIPPHLSEKDLAVRNPNSVYNWLRRHEPRIFLQDGEGSEGSKSVSGKPGALRGAGKRASIPAPSRPDGPVEFVEEDGLGYDVSLGGASGAQGGLGKKDGNKRKRASMEDAGYRPKGGASRPTKKKRKEGSDESTGSKKSGLGGGAKGKAKVEVDADTEELLADSAGMGPEGQRLEC